MRKSKHKSKTIIEFKTAIPNSLDRSQKNRVRKHLNFLRKKWIYFSLVSLNSYNLYVSRMRSLNLFLTKCRKIFKKMSRKNRYRKTFGEDYMPKRFLNSKKMQIFGFRIIKSLESVTWSLRAAIQRSRFRKRMLDSDETMRCYICFNLRKIPFTRKPIGSRMGKGKGALKAWFIRINPGYRIISLKNWKVYAAFRVCKLLRLFLPGNNYVVRPNFHRRREFVFDFLNNY